MSQFTVTIQTICTSAGSLRWTRSISHLPACVISSTIYTSMTSAMVCLIYQYSITYGMIVSVLMTDPAIGYLPGQGYEPYDRGTQLDVWVKTPNGSASLGVVWPGTFYPIWGRKNIFSSYIQASPFSQVRSSMESYVRFYHTSLDWFHPKISE